MVTGEFHISELQKLLKEEKSSTKRSMGLSYTIFSGGYRCFK